MRGSDVGAPKSHPGLIGNKDCCVSITTTELDDVVMVSVLSMRVSQAAFFALKQRSLDRSFSSSF